MNSNSDDLLTFITTGKLGPVSLGLSPREVGDRIGRLPAQLVYRERGWRIGRVGFYFRDNILAMIVLYPDGASVDPFDAFEEVVDKAPPDRESLAAYLRDKNISWEVDPSGTFDEFELWRLHQDGFAAFNLDPEQLEKLSFGLL